MTIQIIGYDSKKIDGKIKKSVKHLEKPWFCEDLVTLFSTLETWLARNIPENVRVNLHYTIGHTQDRVGRKFTSVSTIAFDIDNIHFARIDDYTAVMKEVINLPDTATIVNSGHGLHYLIHLDKPLSREKYVEMRRSYVLLCRKIEKRLKERGLAGEVDNTIHRDTATLRLPNTMNCKPGMPPVKCEIMRERWEPCNWNIHDYVTLGPEKDEGPTELKSYPNPHRDGVLSCPFIKYCKENPEEVSEPMWYAMLSILCRLEDGRDLCHEYSQEYSGYNHTETNEKIDQAIAYAGPRTCDNISTLSAKCAVLCGECPFSVISPISVKGKTFIKTQDSGFHTVITKYTDSGMGERVPVTTTGKPCKEDLMKYFQQKYSYRVLADGKMVYVFEGGLWRPFHDTYLEAFAQDHYVPSPSSGTVSEFVKLIHRTNLVDNNWFNPSGFLNLSNGVLNLETMALLDHDKNFGFTYQLDYSYNKEAICPIFDQFLSEVTLGKEELSDVLMEFFGYAISNMACDHDKALILTGEGSNGKSTLLDVLGEVIGDTNYSGLTADDFKVDTKRMIMKDMLFNIADETPKKAFLDGSIFKNLVSGGIQTARQLYKQACTYRNRTKLIFTCNDLPISGDPTEGMFRRLIIVPFGAYFSDELKDSHIDRKLLTEKAGILNRIIEGYHRLVEQDGFSKSRIISSMVKQYKEDSDSVLLWRNEHIEHTGRDKDSFTIAELYSNYKNFTHMAELYTLNRVAFSKRINIILPEKENEKAFGKLRKVFKGIKLIGGNF